MVSSLKICRASSTPIVFQRNQCGACFFKYSRDIGCAFFFFFNPSEYVWEINSRLSFDIYLSWDFKTTTTKGLFFYYYFKHGCHEYKLDIINV